MAPRFTLISHALCPYVQRAAIVFAEKSIPFERREIDLANKPAWFLAISPLGKTPVLLVDETPIFESAVICEYLDETTIPQLHPGDALQRAEHRSWIEFGSALLNAIGAFYNAADDATLIAKRDNLVARYSQIEGKLSKGPYFSGQCFNMVDAAFAPVFRYHNTFDSIRDFKFFSKTPKVQAWRQTLGSRESVKRAVGLDYADKLMRFLVARNSALSAVIAA
ncbi:MAG: glutathione S-transferase family protein [Aestuariivirga sp.]